MMAKELVDLPVVEQAWEDKTPVGPIKMVNLVATIPGASKNRLIIGGHYDTKRFREFKFLGANDGGSSTAVVLELARVLKSRKNPFTIELLFFDGEEAVRPEWRDPDNTYGSRHYVEAARKAGTLSGLKALVLLDMVGDRNLNFRRDSSSTRWLTDIIWAAAGKLGYRDQFLQEEFAIGGDDHVPAHGDDLPVPDEDGGVLDGGRGDGMDGAAHDREGLPPGRRGGEQARRGGGGGEARGEAAHRPTPGAACPRWKSVRGWCEGSPRS